MAETSLDKYYSNSQELARLKEMVADIEQAIYLESVTLTRLNDNDRQAARESLSGMIQIASRCRNRSGTIAQYVKECGAKVERRAASLNHALEILAEAAGNDAPTITTDSRSSIVTDTLQAITRVSENEELDHIAWRCGCFREQGKLTADDNNQLITAIIVRRREITGAAL